MKTDDPGLLACRLLAIGLGLAVIAWQLVNLALGRFFHEFLVADLVASALILAFSLRSNDRSSTLGMFAGFMLFSGIFLSATTGRLLLGGVHTGTIAAGFGLFASLIGAIGLGRRLAE